jgi:AraC-like DNA-binding protein
MPVFSICESRFPPEHIQRGREVTDAIISRSAFAARCTELVGEPVMHYVARCRMRLAVDSLRVGDASVGKLANLLGYRSEAAFARASNASSASHREPCGGSRHPTRPPSGEP